MKLAVALALALVLGAQLSIAPPQSPHPTPCGTLPSKMHAAYQQCGTVISEAFRVPTLMLAPDNPLQEWQGPNCTVAYCCWDSGAGISARYHKTVVSYKL